MTFLIGVGGDHIDIELLSIHKIFIAVESVLGMVFWRYLYYMAM
jgi:hypothetical protein